MGILASLAAGVNRQNLFRIRPGVCAECVAPSRAETDRFTRPSTVLLTSRNLYLGSCYGRSVVVCRAQTCLAEAADGSRREDFAPRNRVLCASVTPRLRAARFLPARVGDIPEPHNAALLEVATRDAGRVEMRVSNRKQTAAHLPARDTSCQPSHGSRARNRAAKGGTRNQPWRHVSDRKQTDLQNQRAERPGASIFRVFWPESATERATIAGKNYSTANSRRPPDRFT